ncbi:dimethylsulfone monooxygenase SfnG [Ammoniphilus resinae]|uniref:FMNH2-dependent dimethyl sulfone monooxygenase n=1 Tax=Ammoniphilus resinae TaxID=861532 RepID=A0ABS4GW80_9BACL|nr:dimethyl sulfone monooxygenase SfnG [Ammoniphilus resinae]MBP1934528.1 FMNH2-dependent dimethyl sulfone monooxygenase [Ammoniphilus resinae]
MSELKFAYWIPNKSSGLLLSKIPQRTDWTFQGNKRYMQTAEKVGFEYALFPARYFNAIGEEQLEPITLASALASVTEKITLITAVHPGLHHPAIIAKMVANLDHITEGRAAINIVSGWYKQEFTGFGEPWLDHDERYRRSEEFIEVLKQLWTEERTTYKGDFYRINEAPLKPKPKRKPPIFQGGNSKAAKEMAARVSDWYFMNGNTLEGFQSQIEEVKALAAKEGREVKFAANGFVIVRDTEEEALQVLRDIIDNADEQAVKSFQEKVKQAQGMWSNSKKEDLIQYNDGFKTGLVGTAEQVAERIIELKQIGIDLVLTGFLHYEEELQVFGEKVIPLVRKLEKQVNVLS